MIFAATGTDFSWCGNGIHAGQMAPYALVRHEGKTQKITGTSKHLHTGSARTFWGRGEKYCYQINAHGFLLDWSATVVGEKLLLHAALTNRTGHSVHIEQIGFQTQGNAMRCDGDPAQWHLSAMIGDFYGADLVEVLPSANEQYVKMMNGFKLEVPKDSLPTDAKKTDGHYRLFKEYVTLYTEQGEKGVFFAPAGEPQAYLQYELYVDSGSIKADIFSEMCNVLLLDGQSREAQSIVIAGGPFDQVGREVMRHLAYTHGSRTHRGPVTGWCSWYDLGRKVSAQSVHETIDALQSYGDKVSMQVVQIDDGYQTEIGDWRPNEKFSEGLEPIVEKINKLGAMPGIWLAPAFLSSALDLFKEHEDWLCKDNEGKMYGSLDMWGAPAYPMDVTHPQVKEFLRGILKEKLDQGFTYFKIDFNVINANGLYGWDPTKTSLQAHRDVYALYREVIGEESYLLACSSFDRGAYGYADASRTGTDSCPNWADMACCIRETIAQNPVKYIANGVLYAVDPDVTYLRSALTQEEQQMWHSFVGLFGGLQLISDPMAERAEDLRLFQILTPPSKEGGRPLRPVTDRMNQRFGLIIHRPYESFASCLVWNAKDEVADMDTGLDALDEIGGRFHVWSFWDGEYMGIQSKDFVLSNLPIHGGKLLRFTPVKIGDDPQLVGSDLHITMGAAEVADVICSDNGMEICLYPAGAKDGTLHIYSKKPFTNVQWEGCEKASVEMQEDIALVRLDGRSMAKKQRIILRH